MDRPRRVPFEFEYKNNRDREKELEREDNIDPFGVNNPDFLSPVEDIEEENSKPKQKEGALSWLDDVDNLHLPSRNFTSENKKEEIKQGEKNDFYSHNIHDRNNFREKGIEEELDIERLKCKKLEAELNKVKSMKDNLNSKNLLHFINKISFIKDFA